MIKIKIIVTLVIAILLYGCKKDEKADKSLKTVTYTFLPNGLPSEFIYKNVQQGKEIFVGYDRTSLYSVNDQVAIGDTAVVKMATSRPNAAVFYEVRITYDDKVIAKLNGYNQLILIKKFKKEDFQ